MKMIKPNVLIIADKEDAKHLDVNKQSNHWNIFWKIIDYNRLHKSVNELQSKIKEHNIDFILYSRNDQVAKKMSIGAVTKKLEIGYSSSSGIDEKHRIEEMKNCFEDFIRCDNRLDFDIPPLKGRNLERSDNKGTFSLVFDTEQMGGVRYGLPRILELLNEYDVKATFFVTNLMKKVYSNIVEEIHAQGHEIGLHGRWHEYLSNYSEKEQSKLIKEIIEDFGYQIHGANFIGRMNKDTIYALIENGINYFVFPLINYYRFFCYPKLPTNPFLVSDNGEIWMVPICVETYGSPWFSIKNMINSAFRESLKSNKHITILCHPFRDGNMQHIAVTEKLLKYLVLEKEAKQIVIKDLPLSHERHVEVNEIDKINPKIRLSELIPRTKQDYMGMIPEDLMMVYRLIKREHTIW
jgi:peptidoglycan/xylan/chitin deacetylase (PgdA/CDA1 family)